MSVPHVRSIMPTTTCAFIWSSFRGFLSFLCVRHTTIAYSSIDTLSEKQSTQFFHCRPTPWRATYFPLFFVHRRQFHLHAHLSDHNACLFGLFFLYFQEQKVSIGVDKTLLLHTSPLSYLTFSQVTLVSVIHSWSRKKKNSSYTFPNYSLYKIQVRKRFIKTFVVSYCLEQILTHATNFGPIHFSSFHRPILFIKVNA